MSETKPCPFCGGVIELHQGHADITYFGCDSCGAVMSFRPNLKGSPAIAAFNRRPVQQSAAAEALKILKEMPVPFDDERFDQQPWSDFWQARRAVLALDR